MCFKMVPQVKNLKLESMDSEIKTLTSQGTHENEDAEWEGKKKQTGKVS